MAISRITGQDNSGNSATQNVSVAYSGATTAGNLLIAIASTSSAGTATITAGGTFTNQLRQAQGTQNAVTIFSKLADGTETTITGHSTASGITLRIMEYTGNANPIVTDGTPAGANTSGSVSSLSTPNLVTTNASDLILTVAGFDFSPTTPTWTSAASIGSLIGASGSFLYAGELIVSSTGTYSDTMTIGANSAFWDVAILGFQAAGGTTTSTSSTSSSTSTSSTSSSTSLSSTSTSQSTSTSLSSTSSSTSTSQSTSTSSTSTSTTQSFTTSTSSTSTSTSISSTSSSTSQSTSTSTSSTSHSTSTSSTSSSTSTSLSTSSTSASTSHSTSTSSTSTSTSFSSTSTSLSTTTTLIDISQPVATIYPQPLTRTSHDGFPDALMDDTSRTMNDGGVLFGGTTTAIEDIKVITGTNAPKIDIQRQR